MSEQDNIAVIRNMYAAFEKGDAQAILNSVSDNADWTNHGPETIPYAGARRGKDQITEFFRAIADSTTGAKVTAGNFVAKDDTVVVTGRYSTTVRNTGARIDTPIAHIFTLQSGKVVRWEGYSDTAQVAAAHSGKTATGR